MGKNRTYYDVTVLETKALLPSQIAAAIPKISRYKEMTFTALPGTVTKSGEEYILTARGSNQKYALKANDALRKLVGDGRSKVAVSGKVDEPREVEGRKPLPVIDVTEVRESPVR